MEDSLKKLLSLCTEHGTYKGIAQKLCAMEGGFAYEFFCDEQEKSWVVTDRSGDKDKIYRLPFGYEVERTTNMFISLSPESPLYKINQNLHESGKLTDEDMEAIKALYKDMSRPIKDFLTMISLFDAMKKDGKNGKINLYCTWKNFRYMGYTDLFPLAYEFIGTNTYSYAESLIHNKISSEVFRDYVLYDDDNLTGGYIYKTNDMEYLFCLDLFQVLVAGTAGKCNICKRCGSVYFSASGKSMYCHECRKAPNKIRSENRKNNEARYFHKRILDKLLYRYDKTDIEYTNFKDESNYYWSVVQGKKPEKVKEYSAKVKTEADYMEWLEKKYEEIKAQK